VRARAFLVVVSLGAVLAADGRPLPTGEAHRLGRGSGELVRAYSANTISDELATVQPQPGSAAHGDRFDLIDQAGYLGRAVVERVDEVRCGDTTYPRAQVRFIDGHLTRQTVGQIVALRPTLPRPQHARVLDVGAERATLPGDRAGFPAGRGAIFQLVDLDGDRIADIARQHTVSCRPFPSSSSPGGTTSCVEVWRRDAGSWTLVDRVELPPCR
jgi:hypothetical protein